MIVWSLYFLLLITNIQCQRGNSVIHKFMVSKIKKIKQKRSHTCASEKHLNRYTFHSSWHSQMGKKMGKLLNILRVYMRHNSSNPEKKWISRFYKYTAVIYFSMFFIFVMCRTKEGLNLKESSTVKPLTAHLKNQHPDYLSHLVSASSIS